jgi:chromosome segregation ATPase
MAVLDRKEAHVEASFRRLAAVAAAHAVSDGVMGLAIAEATRTGRQHELPHTADSLAADMSDTERNLRRAARLLENAKREIAAARAQGRDAERMIDALEAQAKAEEKQRQRAAADSHRTMKPPRPQRRRRRRR